MKTIAASELRRAPYILLAIFIMLAAGIIAAGCLYYQHYKENYRVEVERRLSAIAELKVNELVRWRNDRLSDAGIFYKNAIFSALVRRFLETPDGVEAQGQIRTWLTQTRTAYKYDRITLLDAQGLERISVPAASESGVPHPAGDIAEVLRSREVTFLDFHRHAPDGPTCLDVLIPILDGQDENRAIGTLTLHINPATYLYPLINQWPTPSRTAETLIIRREGNEAVFLNELKFQKNTALNLRVPLENKELPAVKAALGQEGIVEGIDYSGTPVIAAVRAVPDSPWFLVARMGTSEVYAPLQKELWVTIILVGTLLTGASAGVGFIWKQQSARFYRQKCEAAGALRESEERFRLAVNATEDGIWEWDIQTNQEFFSPRWCEIIGYSVDDPELPHTYKSWASRIHPDDYDCVISAMTNHLEKGTRYNVDYRHRHKSGEYRWQSPSKWSGVSPTSPNASGLRRRCGNQKPDTGRCFPVPQRE